jgi:3D (Asp-Asp-Asp) domain-containing protein
VLGSASLDEAINGIDGLNHLASQNESVIEQTRSARRQLAALSAMFAAHRAELIRLHASAASAAASLQQARAERVSYIGRLADERRLTAAHLVGLELQARAAEAKAETVAIQASSPPTAPQAVDSASPPAAPAGGRTLIVFATGYAIAGHTSTGLPAGWGVVAVDPGLIPLGTRLSIPGYGAGVASDTGGAVRGPTIDLWFPTLAQALAWGRRTITITLN